MHRTDIPRQPVTYEVTRKGRPIRFDSTLTHDQALEACSRAETDFAQDIARKAPEGLSAKQEAWMHKLALDQLAREQTLVDGEGVDCGPILDLFDGMKPGTSVMIDGIRISVASKKARVPGSITVTTAHKNFDHRTYLGWIDLDGTVRVTDEHALHTLLRLAADPLAVLSSEGRRTGICAICSRTLTDQKSVERGYGPACARKFDLPLTVEHRREGGRAHV